MRILRASIFLLFASASSSSSSTKEDDHIPQSSNSIAEQDTITDFVPSELEAVEEVKSDASLTLKKFYTFIGKNEKNLKMAASFVVLAAGAMAVMNTDPESVKQITDGLSSFIEENIRGLLSIPRELARMSEVRTPIDGRKLIALLGAVRLMVRGIGRQRRKSNRRARSIRR